MSSDVKPIPDGASVITPHLVVNNGSEAIDFYTTALGATEIYRMPGPDGKVMHAELEIGGARIFLADEFPDMGGGKSAKALGDSPVTIHLYVEDVDASYQRAVDAGAQGEVPPTNMFWGDRYSKIVDPFGHRWSLASCIENVSPDEMANRMAALMSGGAENADCANS